MNRPRRVVAACLGVLALGTLSACSSSPSNRRVVSDVIESLQLPEDEEACMFARLEGYSDDELDAIADENENWDPASGSTIEEASASMRQFIDDYAECTGDGAAAATGSSQPTATTAPTATSQPPATTSPG